MHIPIIILLMAASSFAVSDQDMKELFKKYEQVTYQHKTELVDEVFTKKFLTGSGGKKEFIEKVKSVPVEKSLPDRKISWRKGVKDEIYFAKRVDPDKKKPASTSEFIIKHEDGKLKIDGTLSDSE